ncbi:MAG: aspartate/glutamate racemase family protein [Phreatobacter sp.]
MRILILNPNTTSDVTDLLVAAARPVAGPQTRIVASTAPRGVPYISTRGEALIGGSIALETLAERHSELDAAIIAAFGDPGLFAARELFDIPVIGMSEAAMLTACMLGQRFAIVTFAPALGSWYRDCVDMHGLWGRCAGIRSLDESFASVSDVQVEKEEMLVALANRAVKEDDADVVILAGAPLAGLAAKVRDRVPVPLVDPIAAALKQAEALVTLNPRKATVGTFRRPAAKPTTGLGDALAARIEIRDLPEAAE